jgi:hypothetical protein
VPYISDPCCSPLLQLEDGLGLWLVAVRNSPEPSPPLLSLLRHLPRVLAASTEHVAVSMALLTSAALMARAGLAAYAQVHNNADVGVPFLCSILMLCSVNVSSLWRLRQGS